MQSGVNANNYNTYSASLKNAKLGFGAQAQPDTQPIVQQGAQSMQNTQPLQNIPPKSRLLSNDQFLHQNTVAQPLNQQDQAVQSANVQNTQKPGGGKKLLFGALIVAAGAGIIALVCKIKGKNSDKAAKKAADTVSAAANKTEGEAQEAAESKKSGILHKVKEKIKSFFNDVKKSYDEYTPSPEPDKPSIFDDIKKGYDDYIPDDTSVKKKHKPKTGGPKPKSAKAIMREKIAGILTSFNDLMPSIEKMSNEADELGKINISTGAAGTNGETEKWVQKIIGDFSSAQSSSLKRAGIGKKNAFIRNNADSWSYNEGYSRSFKTSKVKRRIRVNTDEATVITDNVKDGKKNIETARKSLQFDIATGEIKHYDSGIKKYSDGKMTYAKRADFDSLGAKRYSEGYTKNSDGSVESLIDFDIRNSLYCEMSKINVDGSKEAAKKIKFLPDKKPVYQMEGYKKSATGDITADTRIEFEVGTGEPKYYYENYTYSPVSGSETYSLKAEFRDGKWRRVN